MPLSVRVTLMSVAVCGPSLGHGLATAAYTAERDLMSVQQLLGHARPETTAVYARVPDGLSWRPYEPQADEPSDTKGTPRPSARTGAYLRFARTHADVASAAGRAPKRDTTAPPGHPLGWGGFVTAGGAGKRRPHVPMSGRADDLD